MLCRKTLPRALLLSVLALAVGAAWATAARAQDDAYDDLVRDALSEFSAGRYLESRALFLRAHKLKPSARTLRGLGQAEFGAQLYSRAVVDLSAALASNVNPLNQKMRAQAEEIIRRARSYTGRYSLKLDPPDSEVSVDGAEPIFDDDGKLLLDAGRRQVVVRAPGQVERETLLDVDGGTDSALDLSVSLAVRRSDAEFEDVSKEPPLQREPAAEAPIEVEREIEKPFPWLAASALGLSAAAVGVGIWQWTRRSNRIDSWNVSMCSQAPNDLGCRTLRSGWHDATTASVVSFGIAGAFAAAGVVLLIVRPDVEKPAEASLSCLPIGAGVGCQLRM